MDFNFDFGKFLFFLFGNSKESKKATKDVPPTNSEEVSYDMKNDEVSDDMKKIDMTLKKYTWSYIGEENIKLSLTADKVAIFNENGEEKIADTFVWENRINKIFDAVIESVKSDNSKYCPVPKEIEIRFNSAVAKKSHDDEKNLKETSSTANESIIVREPRWNFDDIYISQNVIDEINKSLLIAKYRDKLFDEWKLGNGQHVGRAIVFNFYGSSGTGKSMTGEAIAAQLGKKIYAVNYSELESKYVGETPKNIVAAFRKAQADDAVLIFDEADSFLGKRLTNVTQSADYGVNITRSVMLLELEKFDGVVIFTTNLVTNYDEAFKRRILTSIKFDLPDETARREIWKIYLRRGLPLAYNLSAEVLAEKFDGISGADIKDMLLHAAVSALYRNEEQPMLNLDDFESAFKIILNRRTNSNPAVTVSHETISAAQFEKETGGTQLD